MTRWKQATVLCAIAWLSGVGCGSFKRFAYEGFGRDSAQQPVQVIAALELQPGERVADLGAGGGYFTFRLAETVGPDGRVYAIDIDPDMTSYLRERAAKEGFRNVEVVEATASDPGLAPDSIDVLFTCNTYHHIGDRTAYFSRAAAALRPGGTVAIIDYDGRGWLSRWFGHTTPVETVQTEMEAAGFRLKQQHDFLPQQSFLIFERAS